MTTVRNLPLVTGSQNGYVNHNNAITEMAAVAFNQITDTLSTPPASPALHDMYIVGASPTGAWSTFAVNSLAYFNINNAWVYYPPNNGLILFHKGQNKLKVYDAGSWIDAPGGSVGGGTGLTVSYFDGQIDSNVGYTVGNSRNNHKILLQPSIFGDAVIEFDNINSEFYCEVEITGIINSPYSIGFQGTNGTTLLSNAYSITRDCSLVAYYNPIFNAVILIVKESLPVDNLARDSFGSGGWDVYSYENGTTTYLDASVMTSNESLRLDFLEIKKGFSAKYKFYSIPASLTVSVTLLNGGVLKAKAGITSFTTDKTVEVTRVNNNNVYLDVY